MIVFSFVYFTLDDLYRVKHVYFFVRFLLISALKLLKKVKNQQKRKKRPKKIVWPALGCCKHPKAGQNTQHLVFYIRISLQWLSLIVCLGLCHSFNSMSMNEIFENSKIIESWNKIYNLSTESKEITNFLNLTFSFWANFLTLIFHKY